MVGKDKFYAI